MAYGQRSKAVLPPSSFSPSTAVGSGEEGSCCHSVNLDLYFKDIMALVQYYNLKRSHSYNRFGYILHCLSIVKHVVSTLFSGDLQQLMGLVLA